MLLACSHGTAPHGPRPPPGRSRELIRKFFMADRKNDNGNSSWTLVKWLVIIGIGIPVLVEVLTLFNLVSVQLWEEERQEATVEVGSAGLNLAEEGERYFRDTAGGVILRRMRIAVGPEGWRFRMEFSGDSLTLDPDSLSSVPPAGEGSVRWELAVDSLTLDSGQTLEPRGPVALLSASNAREMVASFEWELPSGDLPAAAYLRLQRRVEGRPDVSVTEEMRFGNIPTRYREGAEF